MDARADDRAAPGHSSQRGRHELSDRREDDRGIELLGRRPERVAGPLGAELAREPLRGLVARPRKSEDAPALKRATWMTMCADAPNPYRPSRSASPAILSER